ncbi:MAG: hypothetical protein NVS1B4_21590 [Gemmatimonadaceae bacterium]
MKILPAREALALRAWALDLIARAQDDTRRPVAPVPRASVGGWSLFVAAERCALPLKSRLLARGAFTALDPEVRSLLDARATREMQRILAARRQMADLEHAAKAAGCTAIVLKGGAAIAGGGEMLDLVDLDVLVPAASAKAFADALGGRGYDAAAETDITYHMGARFAPDSIHIEVHTRLGPHHSARDERAFARSVALDGTALARLSPPDHLWHLLEHTTRHHPERAGALRDLLLIRAAVRDCSSAEVTQLASELATHPSAPAIAPLLAMARTAEGKVIRDRFAAVAAANYLVATWKLRQLPDAFTPDALVALVFGMVLGRASRRAALAAIASRGQESPSHPWITPLTGHTPFLAKAWRWGLRSMRVCVAVGVACAAYSLALRARRRRQPVG